MRILAINKFYHIFGGSDRYFFELNVLHEQAGHEVIPFSMSHPDNFTSSYDRYFVSQVKYWEKTSPREKLSAVGRVFYSVQARRLIRKLIEHVKPDIVHVHSIYHQISPSILPVIKEYDLPIVQTLHDYKPICPTYSFVSNGQICERCRGRLFYHAALQRCNHGSLLASTVNSLEMYSHHFLNWYDLPDCYLTPSNFMREKMIQYGFAASKITHIPNFVDPEKYSHSESEGDYFVYFGRLSKIKGVATLLRAMQSLNRQDIRLLIIGEGPQRRELETLKAHLDMSMVEFCGFQHTEQLIATLSKAMFTVLPSEWYENCPMSILESMALGKPVIGARIGGIPELIEDGVDGLLFESGDMADLADKINDMVTDHQRRRLMGQLANKKIVSRFSPDEHYKQIMGAYKRLLV